MGWSAIGRENSRTKGENWANAEDGCLNQSLRPVLHASKGILYDVGMGYGRDPVRVSVSNMTKRLSGQVSSVLVVVSKQTKEEQ
jgi:hypothetical protein